MGCFVKEIPVDFLTLDEEEKTLSITNDKNILDNAGISEEARRGPNVFSYNDALLPKIKFAMEGTLMDIFFVMSGDCIISGVRLSQCEYPRRKSI